MDTYYRTYELPWTLSLEQEDEFRKILLRITLTLLAIAVLWPLLPLPERDPNEVIEVPPRIAQLMLEREAPPPPPPPVVEQEPETEPEPEQMVKEVEQTTEPERVIEAEPEPVDVTEQARENASMAGLLPFADELADLRDAKVVETIGADRDLADATAPGELTERSLITSKVGVASGGINAAALSRGTGGGGLKGRTTMWIQPVDATSNL